MDQFFINLLLFPLWLYFNLQLKKCMFLNLLNVYYPTVKLTWPEIWVMAYLSKTPIQNCIYIYINIIIYRTEKDSRSYVDSTIYAAGVLGIYVKFTGCMWIVWYWV